MKELDPSWLNHLKPEFEKDYMVNLKSFLKDQLAQGKTVYPHGKNIFNAFNTTYFDDVKVVILGQDPYHGPNQAHGLSFSVKQGIRPPPSLVNIFKEIKDDLGIDPPSNGCLERWAQQGVLLLNSALTVEKGKAASHRNQGWEIFTDQVVHTLNQEKENLVFLLWGSPAQKKGAKVDTAKHLVLKAPHPSPLSAYRGFFGCRHFSQCNQFLESKGVSPIDW